MRFWKCDFCENCDFENVIFCEICDFENAIFCYKNVNFAKNTILKCEFLEKCDFEHVNFWIIFCLKFKLVTWIVFFKIEFWHKNSKFSPVWYALQIQTFMLKALAIVCVTLTTTFVNEQNY